MYTVCLVSSKIGVRTQIAFCVYDVPKQLICNICIVWRCGNHCSQTTLLPRPHFLGEKAFWCILYFFICFSGLLCMNVCFRRRNRALLWQSFSFAPHQNPDPSRLLGYLFLHCLLCRSFNTRALLSYSTCVLKQAVIFLACSLHFFFLFLAFVLFFLCFF